MSQIKLHELADNLTAAQKKILYETVIKKRDREETPDEIRSPRQYDIAVIGLSGRYPQADNHYEFWEKLLAGTNFIEAVPKDRWNHDRYYDAAVNKAFVPDKTRCQFGAFLKAHNRFDAAFFNINPDDVPYMDPQERLALETAWGCIEDAGYVPAKLPGDIGVFSGVTYGEYQKLIPISSHSYFLSNRIAYFLNFQGPCVTTDAGCCSSLTAIHLACRSLIGNECKTAIVTGANLILHPHHYTSSSSSLSPAVEPLSNPFGSDDGWIPAEGVVCILLKPLKQALEDRDHVYGVIKSSHICQEGKTSWFGAFNPRQQERLIRDNLEKSGIHPETIGYVEAAANGSSLGDAIEMEGLINAFRCFTAKKQFCPIGTVKSNVGHGEGISTMLQLTKVLLQFKAKTLVPLINLTGINPNIKIDDSPFYFQTRAEKWEPHRMKLNGREFILPRRATISSFGTGGTIGHLILEESPDDEIKTGQLRLYFIPLSSKSAGQLRQVVAHYLEFFEKYSPIDPAWKSEYSLSNIMYTLCTGRVHFEERVAFIVDSLDTLLEKLREFLNGEKSGGIVSKAETGLETAGKKEDIAGYLKKQAWRELAEIWVRGGDADFETSFSAFFRSPDNPLNARRVSLPSYCFAEQYFPIPSIGYSDPEEDNRQPISVRAITIPASGTVTAARDEDRLTGIFTGIFAAVLNISQDQVGPDIPLDRYGFNSAMVIQAAVELEKYFTVVPKTLFFECRTIREIIGYFLQKYPEETGKLIQSKESSPGRPGPCIPGDLPQEPGADVPIEELTRVILSGALAEKSFLKKYKL